MLMVSVKGLKGELLSINPSQYPNYSDDMLYDVRLKLSYNTFAEACDITGNEISIQYVNPKEEL